jgi:hypothetical protein
MSAQKKFKSAHEVSELEMTSAEDLFKSGKTYQIISHPVSFRGESLPDQSPRIPFGSIHRYSHYDKNSCPAFLVLLRVVVTPTHCA